MPLLPAYTPTALEAGLDEAGRGCLAGPVVAAAVVLPKKVEISGLDDSKKLKPSQREQLREQILQTAIAWAIAEVSPQEIDRINILRASFLAMHRALDQLKQPPELLLIDGNRFAPYRQTKHHCIIKGDGKYRSIAAASILAKTHRDALMLRLAQDFPQYGWAKNMGYPTKAHREAIRQFGATPHHRMRFNLLPAQQQILFE